MCRMLSQCRIIWNMHRQERQSIWERIRKKPCFLIRFIFSWTSHLISSGHLPFLQGKMKPPHRWKQNSHRNSPYPASSGTLPLVPGICYVSTRNKTYSWGICEGLRHSVGMWTCVKKTYLSQCASRTGHMTSLINLLYPMYVRYAPTSIEDSLLQGDLTKNCYHSKSQITNCSRNF